MFEFMKQKNKNNGFTLIEVLVALAIVVMLGGLSLVTINAIPQARMRQAAQTIKSEFELTRSFAKTHGGDASLSIAYADGGYVIRRTSNTIIENETVLDDKKLAIFYKETGDDNEYKLGFDDAQDVKDSVLTINFSQTNGSIIGPHMLDYIIISNGNKSYKFIIQQDTGMMYYDYEIDQADIGNNVLSDDVVIVEAPKFIIKGNFYDSNDPNNCLILDYTGESIQPELSYDAKNVKIGGVYRAIDKTKDGKFYEITFTLKDVYSMRWADGTKEPKTLIWKIQ